MKPAGSVRRPVVDVLLFRVVFLVVGWAVHSTLRREPRELRWDLDIWGQWDATNLLRIADLGYSDAVAGGDSAAFFPGFPLVVRAVRASGLGLVASGLLVTTVATCIAAYFLARLAEHDGHSGERAVLALLLFPTSVFLVAPYTEAMFLAAALPAFWFAKRSQPWAAMPCVFVATATRSVGVFVAMGVVIELLRRREVAGSWRRWAPAAAVAATGVAPVLLFGLHLHRTKGDFFEFLDAQERGWGRSLTDPLTSLANSVDALSADQTPDFLLAYALELAFALACVLLVAWLVERRQWGYAAFVGGTSAVAMTSVVYVSIPRFALTFFPFMFVIADHTAVPARLARVTAVMGAVTMLGVVAYVNGRWYF